MTAARGGGGGGSRELVHGLPHPALRPHVLAYEGYRERGLAPFVLREVPRGFVVLIVGCASPFRVGLDAAGLAGSPGHRSFVAGPHDRPALVESAGESFCLQVNLALPAAARILGLPLAELANRVVGLGELVGVAETARLAERLRRAPGWPSRFALLDGWLGARLAAAPPTRPDLLWAWRRIEASGGNVAVGDLARSIGCSRKHLGVRFREAFGLPPKTAAGVARFARALGRLDRDPAASLADLAAACGYADQPHLNRDFRRFAGLTPTAYLARRLPAPGGLGEPAPPR